MNDFKIGEEIYVATLLNFHEEKELSISIQYGEIKAIESNDYGHGIETNYRIRIKDYGDFLSKPQWIYKTKNEAINAMINHLEGLRDVD